MRPSPTRFFWTVLRPASVIAGGAVLVIAASVGQRWANARRFDEIVGMTMVCQMFIASSGYVERTARGHFDQVLVVGNNRLSVAAAHWMVSVAPGLPAWSLAAAIDGVSGRAHWPAALTPPALVGLLYVSTACWAGTLRFGRYLAGAVWCGAMFVIGASQHIHVLRAWYLHGAGTDAGLFHASAAALVCPVFLAVNPELADWRVVGVVLAAALACGAGWISMAAHSEAALAERL
jgi:hypothetical protein